MKGLNVQHPMGIRELNEDSSSTLVHVMHKRIDAALIVSDHPDIHSFIQNAESLLRKSIKNSSIYLLKNVDGTYYHHRTVVTLPQSDKNKLLHTDDTFFLGDGGIYIQDKKHILLITGVKEFLHYDILKNILRWKSKNIIDTISNIIEMHKDALTNVSNDLRYKKIITNLDNDPNAHYAILFADADNLKSVNNRFWQIIWDQMIQLMANLLWEVFHREWDEIIRIGGDEFIVLIRYDEMSKEKMTKDSLDNMAKRLIQIVESTNKWLAPKYKDKALLLESMDYTFRLSWGTAIREAGESYEHVLKKAENEAKFYKSDEWKLIRFDESIKSIKHITSVWHIHNTLISKIQNFSGISNHEKIDIIDSYIEELQNMQAKLRWEYKSHS